MGLLDELFDRKPDRPLYHYTSLKGMRGILATGNVWATHIRYLTDRSEFIHAIHFAEQVLQERRSSARGVDARFYSAAIESLKKLDRYPDVFVSSFSEQADALTLWRGYCPAFNGYSLGYDWSKNDDDNVRLVPCVYEDAQKEKLLDEIRNAFAESTADQVRDWFDRRGRPIKQTEEVAILAEAYARWIGYFAPAIKDSSFADEGEWRVYLDQLGDHQALFREGQTMMIPYAEVVMQDADRLELAEIVVGPRSSIDEVVLATGKWVESLGSARPKVLCQSVRASAVPFRPV